MGSRSTARESKGPQLSVGNACLNDVQSGAISILALDKSAPWSGWAVHDSSGQAVPAASALATGTLHDWRWLAITRPVFAPCRRCTHQWSAGRAGYVSVGRTGPGLADAHIFDRDMRRILLLEDEIELREEMAAFLQKRQWQVLQVGNVAEFSSLGDQADIAVIDIMLPDGCGFDVIDALRRQWPYCGIVMLTALGSDHGKRQAFDSGADRYLVKPIKLLELDAILNDLSQRLTAGSTLSA